MIITSSVYISISFKVLTDGSVYNNPSLGQITAGCRAGDKPLSKPMTTLFTNTYLRHMASMS